VVCVESLHFLEDTYLFRRLFKAGYKYNLIRDPKTSFSVRRFEKEGRFKIAVKAVVGNMLLNFRREKTIQKIIDHEAGKFD